MLLCTGDWNKCRWIDQKHHDYPCLYQTIAQYILWPVIIGSKLDCFYFVLNPFRSVHYGFNGKMVMAGQKEIPLPRKLLYSTFGEDMRNSRRLDMASIHNKIFNSLLFSMFSDVIILYYKFILDYIRSAHTLTHTHNAWNLKYIHRSM